MKTYKHALQNKCIGDYSKKKKYFEIATSRYYYSIYLIILKYLNSLSDYNYEEPPTGTDSHKYTINLFLDYIEDKVDDDEYDTLRLMKELRRLRNDYEYKKNYTDERAFKNTFEKKYLDIEEVLIKYIDEYNNAKNSFER